MFEILRQWLRAFGMERKTEADMVAEELQEVNRDDTKELKIDLAKRLHDQRAQLHVLEWQADVQGRRTRAPDK